MPNRDGTGPRWNDVGSWDCRRRNHSTVGEARLNQNLPGRGFGVSQSKGQGNSRGKGRRR